MAEPVSGLAAIDAVFGASLFEAGAAGGLLGGFAGDAFLADAVFGSGALEAVGGEIFAGEAAGILDGFANQGLADIYGGATEAIDYASGASSGESLADMYGGPQQRQSPFNAMKNWFAPQGAQGGGQLPWGSPGNVSGLYSGFRGLQAADQMANMSRMAGQRVDPWGQSGGRAQAGQQLQGVMNGGSDAYMNTPAYKARMQAVQRTMAPYGNSGNLAAAAAQAGGAGYNEYVQQMAGLAGAGNAGMGGQLELSGMSNSNDLLSKSLATLAYTGARTQPMEMPGMPKSANWFQ